MVRRPHLRTAFSVSSVFVAIVVANAVVVVASQQVAEVKFLQALQTTSTWGILVLNADSSKAENSGISPFETSPHNLGSAANNSLVTSPHPHDGWHEGLWLDQLIVLAPGFYLLLNPSAMTIETEEVPDKKLGQGQRIANCKNKITTNLEGKCYV